MGRFASCRWVPSGILASSRFKWNIESTKSTIIVAIIYSVHLETTFPINWISQCHSIESIIDMWVDEAIHRAEPSRSSNLNKKNISSVRKCSGDFLNDFKDGSRLFLFSSGGKFKGQRTRAHFGFHMFFNGRMRDCCDAQLNQPESLQSPSKVMIKPFKLTVHH